MGFFKGKKAHASSSKPLVGFSENGEFYWAAHGATLSLFCTEDAEQQQPVCKWEFSEDQRVAGVHLETSACEETTANLQLLAILALESGSSELHLLSPKHQGTTLATWIGLASNPTATGVIRSMLPSDVGEGSEAFKVVLGMPNGQCLVYKLQYDIQEFMYRQLLGADPYEGVLSNPKIFDSRSPYHEHVQPQNNASVEALEFLDAHVFVAGRSNGDIEIYRIGAQLPKPLVLSRLPTEPQGSVLQFCRHCHQSAEVKFWAIFESEARWITANLGDGDREAPRITCNSPIHLQHAPRAAIGLSFAFLEGPHPVLALLAKQPQGVLYLEAWNHRGLKLTSSPAGKIDSGNKVALGFWMNRSKLSIHETCEAGARRPSIGWEGTCLMWTMEEHNNNTPNLNHFALPSEIGILLDEMEQQGYRSLLTPDLAASCRKAELVYQTEDSVLQAPSVSDAYYAALNGGLAPLICNLVLATEEGISGGFVLEEVGLLENWAFAVLQHTVEDLEGLEAKGGEVEMGTLRFYFMRLEGLRMIFQSLLERRRQSASSSIPLLDNGQEKVEFALDQTEALVASCRIWQTLAENFKSYSDEVLPKIFTVHKDRRELRRQHEEESYKRWMNIDDSSLFNPSKSLLIEVLAERSPEVTQIPAPTPCALALHPYRMVRARKGTWEEGAGLSLYALLDIVYSCCLEDPTDKLKGLNEWLSSLSSSFGLGIDAAEAVYSTWLVDNLPDEDEAVLRAVKGFLRPGVKLDLEPDLHLGVTEALLDANKAEAALRLLKGKPPFLKGKPLEKWSREFHRQHIRALLIANRSSEACSLQSQVPAEIQGDIFHQICLWHHKNGEMHSLLTCSLGAIEFDVLSKFLKRVYEKDLKEGQFLSPAMDLLIGLYLQSNEILQALRWHEEHIFALKSNLPHTDTALKDHHLQHRGALLENYKFLLSQDQRTCLEHAAARGPAFLCETLQKISRCSPRPSDILNSVDQQAAQFAASGLPAPSSARAQKELASPQNRLQGYTHKTVPSPPLSLLALNPALPQDTSLSASPTRPLALVRQPPTSAQAKRSSVRMPPTRPQYSARPLAPRSYAPPPSIHPEAKQVEAALALPDTFMLDTETPPKRMPKQSTPHPKRNNNADLGMDTTAMDFSVNGAELSSLRLGQSPVIEAESESFHQYAPESLLSTPSASTPGLPFSVSSQQALIKIQKGSAVGRIKTPRELKKVRFQGTGT